MTLQISASKSELVLQCARPFEEGVTTDDEVGEPALYGSGFHELMEAKSFKKDALLPLAKRLEKKWSIPGASDELVDHVRASKRLLRRWLAGENPWKKPFTGVSILKEAAFATHPAKQTARRIEPPSVEDHIYRGVKQGEIPGTADLLIVDSIPLVLDYKTGRDPFDFLTIPEDVTQLRTLGLAAWWHSQEILKQQVNEVILAVLHAPRGSVPAIYADLVSTTDLLAHAKTLTVALRRAGDGSLRKGPCCRLCPARHDCPAWLGDYLKKAGEALELARPAGEALKELVEYGPDTDSAAPFASPNGELATPEDVGRLHYFVKQFERLSDAARSLMVTWIADHPDEVAVRPDGKLLVLKTREYEQLSKASIVRAMGKVRGEKLIQELRESGVIETQERIELHAIDDR